MELLKGRNLAESRAAAPADISQSAVKIIEPPPISFKEIPHSSSDAL